MEYIVAIDGPAGSGKSTVAKLISKELEFTYIDTGAMYRMITLEMMEKEIEENDDNKIEEMLDNIEIDMKNGRFFLSGKDVSEQIRTREVSQNVAKTAALKKVRKKLVDLQRKTANGKKAILDGRDIGSVVFPNADLKIYIDATPEERARRRMEDYKISDQGNNINYLDVLNEIKLRDKMDMEREESPLVKADDSVLIDTTSKTIEDVKMEIKALIEKGMDNNKLKK